MSRYEDQMDRLLTCMGYYGFVRQFRFAAPLRQYRLDFAWPELLVAVEVDGGSFVGRGGSGPLVRRTIPVGQHQTIEDYRKRNLLNVLGWKVLSYRPEQITPAEAGVEIGLALQLGFLKIDDERLRNLVEYQSHSEAVRRRVKKVKAMVKRHPPATKAAELWGRR